MFHVLDDVQNEIGRPLSGVNVAVYLAGTLTLASLFSDAAGTLPLANPLTTDSRGNFGFWVNDGTYDLKMTGGTPPVIDTVFSTLAFVAVNTNLFHTKSVAVGPIASGSSVAVTITWNVAFADATYKVAFGMESSIQEGDGLRAVHVEAKTASSVTIRIVNDNDTLDLSGTLDVIGVV